MSRDRPKDAYAALQYLQAQPFVQADRVGLMGWSQGGGVVLLSINDKSIGRPAGLAHGFQGRGVVLSRRLQRPAAVETVHASRAAKLDHGVPLLVLFGRGRHLDAVSAMRGFPRRRQGARQSGRAEELSGCRACLRCAQSRRARELPQYRTGDGPIPVIGTDREARTDAFPRVLEFLKAHLEQN